MGALLAQDQCTFTLFFGTSCRRPAIFFGLRDWIQQPPLPAQIQKAAQLRWSPKTERGLLANGRLSSSKAQASGAGLGGLKVQVAAAGCAVRFPARLVPAIAVAGDEMISPTPQRQ